MKKLLVLALSVLTVIFMASAVMAASTTYAGKVEVKYTNDSLKGFDGKQEASFTVDFTKDFGDGVTAGTKVKVEAGKTTGSLDETKDLKDWNNDGDKLDTDVKLLTSDAVKFDTDGFIKFDRALYDLTLKTGIDASPCNDFADGQKIAKNVGMQLDLTPGQGLTATFVANDSDMTKDLNYVAKAAYTADNMKFGAGYASTKVFDVWASAAFGQLTAGVEYAGNDQSQNALLAKAGYTAGALSVNGSFLQQKKFKTAGDDTSIYGEDASDNEKLSAAAKFRREANVEGSLIGVDASYKLSDVTTVGAIVQLLNDVKYQNFDGKDVSNSIKVSVSNKLTDKLTVEGYYRTFIDEKYGVKATYTVANGVTSSLDVGQKNKDMVYTATFTATL